MTVNVKKMKPVEMVRFLNSTELGTVLSAAMVYRHFSEAGYRIASTEDSRCLSFYRYAAWLIDKRNTPPPAIETDPGAYTAHREAAAQRQADLSLAGRDIGELPEVADPERKEACRFDFRKFCETYFPEVYNLEWSDDHLRAIEKLQKAVLEGGLFALAMARGSGKSSLTETAAIWAMAYGHREFIVIIGASEGAALEMLDSIKTELEVNEHLQEDFPEMVYPIARLEGIANRCAGQLYKGERTRIAWTASEIVLPTIAGAASSGAIVRVAGITGRIRGMKYKRPDGRTIRPEFVIVDDPQTSESAGSAEQTRKRVRVLAGDVLGLAGPGRKIAGVMPCTVIRPGDMAEQMLDRSKHPEWNGERCRMLYKFPKNEELWNRYADLRADELREKGTFAKATAFYAAYRKEMDEGAVVAWPARYNHDEISAVQHAMDLKLTDEAAFWAEYQNEPLAEDLGTEEQLTLDGVSSRVNGHSRLGVPVSATHVTAFIDVQKTMLFYCIVAWDDDFTGRVIDYGEWPDQKRRFFTLNDANVTLQQKFPRSGLEGCLYEGLKSLTGEILGREYFRDDGAAMRIEKCLIDANWGQSTDTVYQFCRESEYASVLTPSHGKYIGASSKPMGEYKKAIGDRVGLNWRMPNVRGKRAIRHVVYDTNFWKSFVATRLLTSTGDRGALTLFGRSPADHLLFAEHLTAEYRVKTEGRGRRVDEWKMRPDAKDNHWWDCVVGSAVAASMCGCVLAGTMTDGKPKAAKPKVKLSELRRLKNF
ncbi:MAG: phage terminase large subunit family protein [Kiritimatiellae bacterium]|nr:phage terminase large subunit family protein [Kiritimatiellia bacterium]